jgi:hypothetical protein
MASDKQVKAEHVSHGTTENSGRHANGYPALSRYFLWADSSVHVNRFILGLLVLCAVLVLLEFVVHRHVSMPGEAVTGFYAMAGFIAFTLIVLAARLLRLLIRRHETYYAPNGIDAESYPPAELECLSHADAETQQGSES